ncbi:MAG: tyrosine-type recombinase/integrase [Candidatus Rokubacteria bacterium]|nr:tyrosine-type recombinase/integrase [Candidatus Rokubacteria bacterium]MBI4628060.1 tyrosine-type recombinase/integrase [Candidatus Rokubacteria bacterium]
MTGCLYRRGKFWWTKVYINGRPVHESTKLTKKSDAKLVLARKVGRIAAGEPIPPRVDRITYDEAVADLRRHYAATGERDMKDVEKRLAHLDPFFRGRRLVNIGPALVTEYVAARQAPRLAPDGSVAKAGAANGTINREVSVLGKLFRLAVEFNKALRVPKLRKLREADPRAGFVERDRFEAIIRRLPEPHALALRVCYALGWRRGEVFGLGWRHVDLQRGALRLEPGETKNGDGRTAFLPPDLVAQLRAHRARVEALQRKLGRVIPDVFVRLKGKQAGHPIGSFGKRWAKACRAAGTPGLLVHDLRRSGIRNMVRSGISEHVAMKISGHKTRSVFDRYDIVSEGDLQEAARRIESATVTKTVTLAATGVKYPR